MGWQPILEGSLADAARASVREIADALAAVAPARADAADVTLFAAYAANAFDDDLSNERYATAMDRFVSACAAGYPDPSLYSGLAGAGWTFAHLTDGESTEEVLATIDQSLIDVLQADFQELDLIRGTVGLGVYFLERLAGGPRPLAATGLALVIERLAAAAEVTEAGTTWHTPVDQVPVWQRVTAPDGYYNCGLAHGVPGIIAMLASAAGTDLEPDARGRARQLAEDGARWLIAQRLPPNPRSAYPSFVGGVTVDRARTAWCYGDPGVAAALWSTARRLSGSTRDAETLAGECIARDPSICGVRDAGLCHGATGLGHIYNRFFHASGDASFRDAARGWFARALTLRAPGEGVAGYRAYARLPVGPGEWRVLPGFLEGAAGIGLALLAAVGDAEPAWDRMLLCDIPPREQP